MTLGKTLHLLSNLRLFADDSLVYFAIETPHDCLTLQKDLDKLSLWASKWQMTFNVTKCKTLSITRKRNPIYHQYSMNNQPLESVRNHPYLGVEVTQKLNWSNHIDNITAEANRSLSFVKRNLKRCPENIKEQAYKSLVRPHLEYASTVWSPHQKYQIDKLEAVQRKAARFIKNCWSREQGTVTELLADLKWDTLQVRREKARLLMFYKATHGLVDIPLPDTLIPLLYSLNFQLGTHGSTTQRNFTLWFRTRRAIREHSSQAQLLCGIVFHPVSWTNQTSPNLDKL